MRANVATVGQQVKLFRDLGNGTHQTMVRLLRGAAGMRGETSMSSLKGKVALVTGAS
ncbi:MAG: hypothetical protein HYT86_05670, partial [candidate division NC10 bacterium]|nr:hypothetical protein [candidate division NC10 bacterium]